MIPDFPSLVQRPAPYQWRLRQRVKGLKWFAENSNNLYSREEALAEEKILNAQADSSGRN